MWIKTSFKVLNSRSLFMKVILFVLLFLILGLTLVVIFVPPQVEKGLNQIINPPPYNLSSETASKLHSTLLIADLHADPLLFDRDLLKKSDYGHVDVPRLIEGNVALQVFTVVTKVPKGTNIDSTDADSDQITLLAMTQGWPPSTWFSLKERALYQADKFNNFVEESNGKLTFIKTTDDLEQYLERRKTNPDITAGLLGLEGAHALEGDISNLDILYDAGFRLISPTHFFDNEVGGSAHGIEKEGLTDFGREVIIRMDELNMIIDLAHASPKTIDDVLEITDRPVIVSHTGVRGTYDNNRNLSDEYIRKIADTGGVIGIGYWETATGGKDAKDVAKAIRYTADIAGVEHVALGSDFDGAVPEPFDTTGLVQITEALIAEGFSEDEIYNIMGGNFIRLLSDVLPKN